MRPALLLAVRAWLAAVLLLAGLLAAPPSQAQAPAAGPPAREAGLAEPMTPAAIDRLLAELSDEQLRAILRAQLSQAAGDAGATQTRAAANPMVMRMDSTAQQLHARLALVLGQAGALPAALALVADRLAAGPGVAGALLALAVVCAVGLAARLLWRRLIRRRQDLIAGRNLAGGGFASLAGIGDALIWLVLELSGVAIFYAAAMVTLLSVWPDDPATRLFVGSYVAAMTATLAVMAATTFGFPRRWAAYRLLPLSDRSTAALHRYVLALAVTWNFGFLTCQLLHFYGIDLALRDLLILLVGTLFLGLMLAGIWQLRHEVRALIRGAQGREGLAYLRNLLADNWHWLASAYMVLLWALANGQLLLAGEQATTTDTGLKSLLLFILAPALEIIIGRFVAAQLGPDSPIGAALMRTVRVLLVVGAVAIFLSLWGFDRTSMASVGIAQWLLGAAFDIGVTALVGYAVWQLIRAVIDSRLAAQLPAGAGAAAAPEGEGGGAGATRAATLLPLLRSFALAVIAVMCVLTALASLGINIGPLLAGAGVVGLAVGFGAQTLVKDVVSGLFFLIDDAFRIGEYIDIGSAQGTVEKISVRSFRLRHHRGALHTIPFGEIQTLTNYSRDWVIMKLPLRLALETDPQAVKKIVKTIGQEMAADPELGPMLLEPPKSQGVLEMDDGGILLRIKFMAKPGEQFVLRRELLHRIRAAFAAADIQFASRQVTVHVAAGAALDEPTAREAGAAAARRLLDDEAAAMATQTAKSG